MWQPAEKYLKFLLLMMILTVCFENVTAQNGKDIEVPILQEITELYRPSGFSPVQKKDADSELLETRAFESKGCLQLPAEKEAVIKDPESFKSAIRRDRDQCLKGLEEIDFSKYALLGIGLTYYYVSNKPYDLKYEAVKDIAKKRYLLNISYREPQNNNCRCLGQYEVWLLVPKLPEGYDVYFDVKTRDT